MCLKNIAIRVPKSGFFMLHPEDIKQKLPTTDYHTKYCISRS